HSRASYLLIGLVPACALGAVGLDLLARAGGAAGFLLAVLVGAWACTAYASFWIDPRAAATQNWAGDQYLHAGLYDAAWLRFRDAFRRNPHPTPTRVTRGRSLLGVVKTADAHRLVNEILQDDPDDPDALLLLGYMYGAEGRVDAAVESLRRASELAPDH